MAGAQQVRDVAERLEGESRSAPPGAIFRIRRPSQAIVPTPARSSLRHGVGRGRSGNIGA